jgi:predicted nucleic acid-binding protein
MPRSVFVDTSCWVGFFLRRDQHHREAVGLLQDLMRRGRPLMTSSDIVAETVTRLRKQGGFPVAYAAWEELEKGEVAEVIHVGAAERRLAREVFKKHSEHVLSVADCTSFVLMKRFGIREAATFDEDFRNAGFVVLP